MNQENKKPLNPGQQAAADGFSSFLFSEDKELIISGAGGYGKTFLMGHLIDVALPRYHQSCEMMGILPQYDNVEMTATTNKAAEELGKATGRPAETVHTFLSLRVKEDFRTGKTFLTRNAGWQVHEKKILFVDECSMIDRDLHAKILEGTVNSKIVYVGDHRQLPPVFEDLSPIYTKKLPFFELTQPMRNAGQPALMALCQQMRDTVDSGIFNPIQVVPGVIDWLDPDAAAAEVADQFIHNDTDSRILAYSNPQVNALNAYIRAEKGLPEEYSIGEHLISNAATQMNDREALSIEMGVTVMDVASETTSIRITGDVYLECREMTLMTDFGSTYLDVPVPVDKSRYEQLVKYFAREKDWPTYFKLKQKFPDLRPRTASTVHKAQGQSLDTVFIDLDNLSTCTQAKVVAHLLYVAVSRARNRVVLYGTLAPKYGGLIK